LPRRSDRAAGGVPVPGNTTWVRWDFELVVCCANAVVAATVINIGASLLSLFRVMGWPPYGSPDSKALSTAGAMHNGEVAYAACAD